MKLGQPPAIGLALILLSAPADAATWNAGSGDYSVPGNWDPVSVPCFEIVPVASTALIDTAGVVVTQDVPLCTVQALTLTTGASLSLPTGTQYIANGSAQITGTLDGNGGSLTANGTTFGAGRARLFASLGSRLELDAAALDATAVPLGQVDLLAADGAASQIVLAGLTDIDAGFNSTNGSVQSHVVTASDGGQVDLSALASVSLPFDLEDRLTVRVRGTGSVVLDSLASSTGSGQLYFDVADGGSLDLPALSQLANGRFIASDGGHVTASASDWALNSAGLFNLNYVLVGATGSGTMLDLSGLSDLDAGFDSTNGAVQSHSVEVGGGADVDLSGLTSVLLPIDREDRLTIQVSEESTLDLSALATSTGTGQLFFSVFDDAALDLPALDAVLGGRFFVSSGGRINANSSTWTLNSTRLLNNNYELARASGASSILDLSGLASIDAGFNSTNGSTQTHSINADSGGLVDLSGLTTVAVPIDREDRIDFTVDGGGIMNLDALATSTGGGQILFSASNGASLDLPGLSVLRGGRFFASSGGQIGANATAWELDSGNLLNNNYVLVSAADSGTALDLSGLRIINAGFNSTNGAVQAHTVQATTGAAIDLSGIDIIEAPADAEDVLRFTTSGGALMALGPLDVRTGAGRVEVRLDPVDATLAFPRGLDVVPGITVLGIADGRVEVAGDLAFSHTDEAAFNIEAARVVVQDVDPLTLEVGGTDEGTLPSSSPNFGFGQLVVGSAVQTTTVLLVDRIDNGNGYSLCGSTREALYLYGYDVGPDSEGLRILNGSTLDLRGVSLYAAVGGVLMDINQMVIDAGGTLSFDEGLIVGGTEPDQDSDGVPDSQDNCVLAPNPGQEDSDSDGFGNACDADLNGDVVVNAVDLGQLRLAFFSTPVDANWNPNADFNSDGVVNVIDLGIMRALFFAPPGPSCVAP